MTQDEIIRMAREAGFEVVDGELRLYFDGSKALLKPNYMGTIVDGLKEFAALVATNEREKQAVQEPVAIDWEPLQNFWRNNSGVDWEELESAVKCAVAALGKPIAEQEPVGHLCEASFGRGQVFWFNKPADNTPLYAAPIHTKDLTDAEAEFAFERGGNELCLKLRAVITKFKEKNR